MIVIVGYAVLFIFSNLCIAIAVDIMVLRGQFRNNRRNVAPARLGPDTFDCYSPTCINF